jgi:two-component system nitrogen regulation sensor histidine kinase NtrY
MASGEASNPATADGSDKLLIKDVRLPFADTNSRSFSVGMAIVILSAISALATYLILTNLTPIPPSGGVVLTVLTINAALIIAMIVVIAQQAVTIRKAWREKVAGARLHIRIMLLFSVIAILPALILAIVATTTFVRAIDGWFADRTRAVIERSVDVANAYLEEHGQVIRTDVVNMARDLDDAAAIREQDAAEFRKLVFAQAGLRDLPVAYVIDASGKPLITAIENERLPYRAPPQNVIALAEQGQVPLLMPRDAYRVAAIVKLQQYPGQYLFVARGVSPVVLRHLREAEAGVAEYTELRKRRNGLQVAHALLYLMIALTGLLVAIWAGLWFAGKFVSPISRLIEAAEHVSEGNLAVTLPERRGEGDLRRLSMTFNKMTEELTAQRDQLVERRRFIEAVLSGVTAGVIGLSPDRSISIVNKSAADLLKRDADDLIGKPLDDVLPEFAEQMARLSDPQNRPRRDEPMTVNVAGEDRTFAVRLTREAGAEDEGAVITFDDITELVIAQRQTAWADVARRIAHEIKNPLTPIQLSAERIQRKYGKVLTEDREVFDKCTSTIIRQVSDVARMVDEFSNFARMPKPVMAMQDLRTAVREPVTLFEMGSRNLDVQLSLPEEPVRMALDSRLIGRVMTNLVKNAAEATEAKASADGTADDYKGRVEITVTVEGDNAIIDVVDNGTGLDKAQRARLLEPYVTTKAKGTGVGLAITNQIIEQHNGTISLNDAPVTDARPSGAWARVVLPIRELEAAQRDEGASREAAE